MKKRFLPFFGQQTRGQRKEIQITKRQRFIIAVLLLSIALFITEHNLGRSGFYITVMLSFLTSIFFVLSMWKDIRGNFTPYVLILPFFYTLAFGLFYFLTPTRILSRVALTSLFAIGLYSLYLSLNIFTVASIRTIGLLSSARTVTFIITLISYFFLLTIIYSLHASVFLVSAVVFFCSFFLTWQSLWTITLEKSMAKNLLWIFVITFCLFELSLILWFWPAMSVFIALFLTGFFYTIVGLSHVWFERRFFKGILWEYIWVSVVVFCILLLLTSWRA